MSGERRIRFEVDPGVLAMIEPPKKRAARLMRVFREARELAAAAGEHLTFAAFVRMIDPTMPMSPKEYRVHRTYCACCYLRQIWRKGRA